MKVGVIADDLTGANGIGVKLSSLGFQSIISFSERSPTSVDTKTAICMDTDSRYIQSDQAELRVKRSLDQLQKWGAKVICKRIDSTFRGNIGAEVNTVIKNIEEAVAIIVPSFPEAGRIVVGGYLLVNGTLLHETDVANDPISPLQSSHLPTILKGQVNEKIALIELKDTVLGVVRVEEEIRKKINDGYRMIICDAVTDHHIETIAKAMVLLKEKNVIPVDPGSLTTYFVNHLIHSESKNLSRVLVSIGSVTDSTKNQLEYLLKQNQLTPVYVNPEKLSSFQTDWNEEINRVVMEVEAMKSQSIVVITTNHPNRININLKKRSLSEGVPVDRVAKRITEGLAEISKKLLLANNQIEGCFFSGGDVTASFCKAVKAEGIYLIDEVMPLVAHGEIMGGSLNGLSIVTKGGLVGGVTAIDDCIHYLKKSLKKKRRTVL